MTPSQNVQQTFSLSLLILSFISSLLSVCTANSIVYVKCSQLNFTSMTPYESNVNSLFNSLADSASLYNFNKFETSPQSDCVYGLFQCRGDLSFSNCKDCVANAVSQLKEICPMSVGGEIQLEGCFVKYDDTSFFGVEEKIEVCKRCGPSMGYNSDVINRIDSALAYLVDRNREYFRGGDFGSIHGVAQCVQDLSLSDCQDCLSEACGLLKSECETSTWGDMYLGKCYIRYASEGNENPANNSNSTFNDINSDGGNSDMAKWIPIIGAILVGGVLFIGLIFAYRKKKEKPGFKLKDDVNNLKKGLDETNGEVKDVKKDLDRIKGGVKDVKKGLDGTKDEVKDVRKDLDGTKVYAINVKQDLDGTKGEVKDVKKDLAGVKGEVRSIKKDVEDGKELFNALSRRYCGSRTPMQPPCPSLPPSDPCRLYLPPSDPCRCLPLPDPCPYLPPSNPCPYLPYSNPNTCDSNPNTCTCM